MNQPEELTRDAPLLWSPGKGTEVWALFQACIAGDLPAVERLVRGNPALVRAHYQYRRPIYFAVRENQLAVAAWLLERHATDGDLAVLGPLLEVALDRGYAEMEQLLIAKQPHVSPRGEPVAAAIRDRDLPRLRLLLDANPGLLHAGDASGNQPIHWAVMSRQPQVIDELLARGADPNARRPDGARPIQLCNGDYHYRGWRDVPGDGTATPLEVLRHLRARGAECDICTAAHIGDEARVRELLDADPSLANRASEYVTYYPCSGTPLRNAAGAGHLDLVRLLLERGADPNLPEEGIAPHGHALYAAVYHRHHAIARLLLERGAWPSPEVESSADALSIAILNEDKEMVALLASYGAARSVELLGYYGDVATAAAVFAVDPDLADDPVAFGYAADNGHEGFLRLMLRHRPELIRRVSVAGKTPVLTEWLFAQGMDPNRPDWLGVTALHRLARAGDIEQAALFLHHGAALHARDEDSRSTPLAWAAREGKSEMVRFLLARGARSSLPDDPPWATPLAWARRKGHPDIVSLLELPSAH